ncbi:MAG: ADP-ribosylglycohydrolase family protein [Acidaminococcaceae bacterium]|nr:ADP-ribosylglycohydrolase family protein [Acidaminococcaceae bacterium]
MSKFYDGVMGVIVGDAVGVPFEFQARGRFCATGMTGYGTFDLPPGSWSDDSSMTLATVESLAKKGTVDIDDIMLNFSLWLTNNYFTPYGKTFDVGGTTYDAIQKHLHGTLPEQCGGKENWNNGNGALMRILPLAFLDCDENVIDSVSSLTHAHDISKTACRIYINIARQLLQGADLREILKTIPIERVEFERLPVIETFPRERIESGGYVLDTIEAALWSILHSNSYRECILTAVNLGSDTDTTGAVAGGLAGIIYGTGGEKGIPKEWIDQIARKEWIKELCDGFDKQFGQMYEK